MALIGGGAGVLILLFARPCACWIGDAQMNTPNLPWRAAAAALASSCATAVSCNGPKGTDAAAENRSRATFVARVNQDLVELSKEGNAAGWTQATYITPDTEIPEREGHRALSRVLQPKAGEAKALRRHRSSSPDRALAQAAQARRERAGAGDAAKRARAHEARHASSRRCTAKASTARRAPTKAGRRLQESRRARATRSRPAATTTS